MPPSIRGDVEPRFPHQLRNVSVGIAPDHDRGLAEAGSLRCPVDPIPSATNVWRVRLHWVVTEVHVDIRNMETLGITVHIFMLLVVKEVKPNMKIMMMAT